MLPVSWMLKSRIAPLPPTARLAANTVKPPHAAPDPGGDPGALQVSVVVEALVWPCAGL